MKFSKEERLRIGQEIYNDEITKFEASEKYGIGIDTARTYMRLYRDTNGLQKKGIAKLVCNSKLLEMTATQEFQEYKSMTKEQLICELVNAQINEARLKKGYEVKGVGSEKEFSPLENKNIK